MLQGYSVGWRVISCKIALNSGTIASKKKKGEASLSYVFSFRNVNGFIWGD